MHIILKFYSSGIILLFHIFPRSLCTYLLNSWPVFFSNPAWILSIPGALLFLSLLVAIYIFSIVGTGQVSSCLVALVMWWLVCLPLDTKFSVSNPAKEMDFFKGDKSPQHTFLSDGK
jgi:hypothetical protein